MRGRAYRRQQRELARKRARDIVTQCYRMHEGETGFERTVYLMTDTPKLCSCPMCGHARENCGKSISELRREPL